MSAQLLQNSVPVLARYEESFRGLYKWFFPVLYGFIGALSTYIIAYNQMDIVSDRFQAAYFDTVDTFDFIVVGAGSAGSVLANRLSENFNVLLLEVGGEPNPWTYVPALSFLMLSHPQIDWNHNTVPQKKSCFAFPNQRSGMAQGKGLGGTSNLNFLIYLRGHPKDFDHWANVTGDSSWSYNGVLPYFKKAEDYHGEWDSDYHGHGGEMTIQEPPFRGMAELFVKAGQDLGYNRTDLNAPYTEGFSPIYMPMSNGRRGGSFQVFLEPIRKRKTLTIFKFAHVNKVLLRGPNNEAYGVEYERHGVQKVAYAKKEIIISAGAVQSPKILMLSGLGPKEHLESHGIPVKADLPVGKNLQDHISTYLGPFFVNETVTTILDRDFSAKSFIDYTHHGTGHLTSPGVHAAGLISSSKAQAAGLGDWPDIQYIFLGMGVYQKMAVDFSHAFHVKRDVMVKYLEHAKGRDSFQIITSLARPLARGEVLLADTNPQSPSLIDPKYLELDEDMEVLIEGVKRAVELAENTTTFRKLGGRFTDVPFPGCENVPFRSDAYWECYVRHYSVTLHHIVGTCSMGQKGSKTAVVDNELRVLGTRRLRVVDASVMPLVPVSNTHAACVMLGEKGADMITKKWLRRSSSSTGSPDGGSRDPIFGPYSQTDSNFTTSNDL